MMKQMCVVISGSSPLQDMMSDQEGGTASV